MAAGITFLSDIQAKARNIESEVVSSLLQADATSGMAVNKITAIPLPLTTYIMKGASFKSDVMIAAYDSTSVPEVLLYEKFDKNGNPIGKPTKKISVEGGKGKIEIPTSKTGFFNWGGVIKLKDDLDQLTEYPFKGSYQVSEPAVVVSATKMNVMYRGVLNPITVSVPGVPSEDIVVTAPGSRLKKKGPGIFDVDVTNLKGRQVNIRVSAKLPSGELKAFPRKYIG